ncbi:MAG TPA: hypothetical protein VMF61_05750 [Candidatus Acidoferrales bacterium]|nr:hypothetical protein [Candidatus Acidoferrales bacterium]
MKRWEVRRHLQSIDPPVHFVEVFASLIEVLTSKGVLTEEEALRVLTDAGSMS